MTRHGRKDAVHRAIVDGLRAKGIVCFEMPEPGDVLCFYHGCWLPLEFKSDQRTRGYKPEMTKAQAMRSTLAQIPIVHSLDEALALFGIVRS